MASATYKGVVLRHWTLGLWELCERWGWRNEKGRVKDMAARAMLLKLERLDNFQLPPRQSPGHPNRRGYDIPDQMEMLLRICQFCRYIGQKHTKMYLRLAVKAVIFWRGIYIMLLCKHLNIFIKSWHGVCM
ncbi:MAG: hypothetical protein EOM20_02025 [Spartobacteria bacterium]|nr:hypothetical protein [Spartobacteria bacterium]